MPILLPPDVTYGYLLLASLIYMTLWFVVSRVSGRADVVDSAWGLGFVYVASVAYFLTPLQGTLQTLTLLFTAIWGLRLFAHITLRNARKPEDARYTAYRKKWGKHFAWRSYTNIFLLQGILFLLISAPVIAIMHSPQTWVNGLGLFGFVVWSFGIIFETVSDYQLHRFLKVRKKGQIMQTGLWKYSRHPNYFGEIICWAGAGLIAASVGSWWGLLGPVLIAILIIKISGLPPLEKRYAKDRAYQKYAKKTSVLIPLPPKR